MNVQPGDQAYYVKYRPVFQIDSSQGAAVSPNLAGRLASSFGLCAQIFASTNPPYASICKNAAVSVFSLAQTNPAPNVLVTAAPYDFYPETEWRDDMELGAVELYYATGDASYLSTSGSWATAYIQVNNNSGDTINLYDVSGLAHYELYNAITKFSSESGKFQEISESHFGVTPAALLSNLQSQLNQAVSMSTSDPFQLGEAYDGGDIVPHVIGLWLEASFFNEIATGSAISGPYADFMNSQRNFIFGNNAWGTSFIIGAGSMFPDCPQHQVANLVGSLNATSNPTSYNYLRGAVVDGPSASANFQGLGIINTTLNCPTNPNFDPFKEFSGHGLRYWDWVGSWPSVEPADDYTVISLLTFARMSIQN
jgi:endoglucanase